MLVWLVSWGGLHLLWRANDTVLRRAFWIGLGLGLLGVLGTFPPFFEAFE